MTVGQLDGENLTAGQFDGGSIYRVRERGKNEKLIGINCKSCYETEINFILKYYYNFETRGDMYTIK